MVNNEKIATVGLLHALYKVLFNLPQWFIVFPFYLIEIGGLEVILATTMKTASQKIVWN